MTNFTDTDRKLILKIARRMQANEGEIKTLQREVKKLQKKDKAVVPEIKMPEALRVDTCDVVFSEDVDWTPNEKDFALKSLYSTLRTLCEDVGILKLTLKIDISDTDEGI